VKKAIVIALVVAAGVVTLTAFRHAGFGPGGRDPARMAAFVKDHVDDVLDDVDATPDQRQQIQALVSGVLEQAQSLHQGQADAHAQLLAAWKSDAPDAAQLHALVDQRVDAMRAVAHQAVDAGVKAHAILTPEQRAKVTKKLERRAAWHE
jgi:periplasmic protein CpxP/Spy